MAAMPGHRGGRRPLARYYTPTLKFRRQIKGGILDGPPVVTDIAEEGGFFLDRVAGMERVTDRAMGLGI